MEGKLKNIINIPNYKKVFSYIDKGILLYYFNLYNEIKIVSKLQAIDSLSYGLKLYKKTEDNTFEKI